MRGMPKALAMLMQDRRQEVRIGGIALFDHLPVTDEAMLHFGIVHFMPEFGLMRFGLAPPQDLGMGLTETHLCWLLSPRVLINAVKVHHHETCHPALILDEQSSQHNHRTTDGENDSTTFRRRPVRFIDANPLAYVCITAKMGEQARGIANQLRSREPTVGAGMVYFGWSPRGHPYWSSCHDGMGSAWAAGSG
jgi:hypothetical protein